MKTINLKDYRSHPNMPLVIFLGVLVLLFLVNALTPTQAQPVEAQPTPALSFIMVIATAQPTVAPTVDTQVLQEIEALRSRVAELEAARSAPVAEPQQVIMVQAVPTVPPPPTAEPVQLQTFALSEGEEPLSDALRREAMDQ